jgi:hypothetical protein
VLLRVMFLSTPVAWLASGGTKELGVQLSLRKAAIEGVVSREVSAGSGIAAGLSNKTGATGAAIIVGNSPPRATRATSTSIICLIRFALFLRYP